jgi:hypothetical protein
MTFTLTVLTSEHSNLGVVIRQHGLRSRYRATELYLNKPLSRQRTTVQKLCGKCVRSIRTLSGRVIIPTHNTNCISRPTIRTRSKQRGNTSTDTDAPGSKADIRTSGSFPKLVIRLLSILWAAFMLAHCQNRNAEISPVACGDSDCRAQTKSGRFDGKGQLHNSD